MINGFYTAKEAAKLMGLSEGHVRNLCAKGQMSGAQKMGWAWVIPQETIDSYKPGPQGFAAVWKKIREKEAEIEAEKAAMGKGGEAQ